MDTTSAKRPLVAVVNDDPAFIHLLDTLLKQEGYDMLPLQSGELAYQAIKMQRPQCIIVDISLNMADMSWRVVDLVIFDSETVCLPIIVCSVADQQLRDRMSKLSESSHAIIEKPFRVNELIGVVRQALEQIS